MAINAALAGKSWQPPTDYGFLRHWPYFELAAQEVEHCAAHYPLAVVRDNETWKFVALLRLPHLQETPFITQDGSLAAGYVPFAARCYPFRIAENDDQISRLGFDEDSGMLRDDLSGTVFFNDDNKRSEALEQIITSIEHWGKGRNALRETVAVLAEQKMLKPLTSGDRTVPHCYVPDMTKITRCSDKTLNVLHLSGALIAAHGQVFSAPNFSRLRENQPSVAAVDTSDNAEGFLQAFNKATAAEFSPRWEE